MTYLLDTNIVSEFRRVRPHGAVIAWLHSVDEPEIHLAAVPLGEIQAGIELERGEDPAKALAISRFLDHLVAAWNILPMDADLFRRWARLMHGRSRTVSQDAMIAVTAERYGLVVVTRHIRDFIPFGVRTLDPFAYIPP